MPSVKISELPILNQLSANNANTVFVAVDKTSNTTSQFPTNTLAAALYANNILNVGTQTPSTFPGLIAQFVANTAPYGQVNFENANTEGSMDVVFTADIGDDANNYLDLGINNSVYSDPQYSATKAVDGYLIIHGSSASDYVGNLVLGTAQAETNVLFAVGGTTNLDVVAKMTKNGLEFDNSGYIRFDDGSTQTVAASPASVTLDTQANTIITQGIDVTQNTRLNSIETINTDQNTAISIIQGVDVAQNTRLNSIETVNVDQNTAISIIQGTDVTQNTRLNSIETINTDQNTAISIIQGTNLTQNTWISSNVSYFQGVNNTQNTQIQDINVAITIIQGVDATQNTQIGGIQGVDLTQNSAISIIQGVDLTQNSLISIIQGVDLTQNSWISANQAYFQGVADATNTAISIIQGVDATQNTQIGGIQGVDVAQNTRISIIEGVDATQNIRLNSIETINTSQNTSISIIQGVDNTQNTNITTANNHAWAAFTKANNALANTFSITVNNSIYIPGSLVVDGLVFANGASYVANVMSIPTTYASPQTAITLNYQQANIVKTNITSDLVVSHSNIVLGKFIDLFVYNDSATTQTITHGISANNSTTKGTTIKVAPYNTKHLRYFTINSDLANTYVAETVSENYINEDVYFAGDLTMNGTVIVANTNFAATEAAFRITAAGSSQNPTQAGTLMQLTNKPNVPARVLIDSFGTSNTAYSIIAGRAARGTVDAPTATQNNDILLRIAGNSYGDTGYAPFGDARIDFVATENRSDTNRGSRIRFWNTPNGSNVVNEIASFNADSVYFTGTVSPEKGFIYTPNIYPSSQTAITIDFANNSVVRAQTSAGLVVTLSNFVVGKMVEAWITNTAGTGQTFTHGVSAINSTINSTTYSIPATSSIFVKYWCMDGTLANTMVAITKG